ncbi:MAG: DNA topoisomerase VI, partial [Thermoprotei archaeon]
MPVLSDKDVLRKLETFGRRIYYQIEKGIEPHIYIPVRTLANTVWDKERKMLILGPKKARRNFFDIGESKRFMQTLLMLSIIIKARREGDYPTIRDLYYTGKHTIEYIDEKGRKRAEETWNSQNESNAVIQDIEVATGLLREHMGIMHDAKGKIVGNVIIRSKGYEINLARLGSGSYAIPPNADKLEIVEVDADYVLVIEKDAIFERLNEEEFWKKHNCVLITGKGQPDRSTRRMVRRLWEEFGLPVYVLTDCD